ncbi:hypothetical protein BCD67_10260 [Oscillatoriales cyanobacterium USR001]|nr:hypothetical protein BCD67_10260 [Oscillatoriales cyanobacterium USR001]
MSPSSEPTKEPNILGKFASVVGLVGAALFFTGWIYRWSYFYFFQLEITTLDLPAQSFFIVPLQVFLADGRTIAKSAMAFLFTGIAIYLSLWIVSILSKVIFQLIDAVLWQTFHYVEKRKIELLYWVFYPPMKSLLLFNAKKFNSIEFLRSLVDEIIIVGWILLMLFHLARNQGIADAQRDAGENSTLPVVTLVIPENRLALGRKLNDVFDVPPNPLKGYKFIGDRGLFNKLYTTEETDIVTNPEKPIIWRLLLERSGWIYLFKALPKDAKDDSRPLVLAIQESNLGEQLMIFSPEPSKLVGAKHSGR